MDMALEQGREIYCVPGRVTDRLSDGCNRLIAQGAGIMLSPEDLVEKIAGESLVVEKTLTMAGGMSPRESLLYSLLSLDPVSAEQLHLQMITSGESEIRLEEVLELLWELILKGKADTVGGCYYVRGH